MRGTSRIVAGVAVFVALLVCGTGVASAVQSDLKKTLANCEPGTSLGMSTRPSSVCVALSSSVAAFSTTPGTTYSPSIREVSATAVNGYQRAQGNVNPSFIWSDWFSNTTNLSGYVDATWTVKPIWEGPIGQQSIALHISGDPAGDTNVTCDRVSYIVCNVAPSRAMVGDRKERYTFSYVHLSSRPLIVRVVNQTGHLLQRTSPSVLTSNLLRDDRIGDPASIPSYDPAASEANVGWYQFYRYAVRANRAASFETTYTLKPGTESNLNGATVRILLALKSDGSDDNSRCIADDRFATYLQCSVAVAGSASGRVIATIYVAQ